MDHHIHNSKEPQDVAVSRVSRFIHLPLRKIGLRLVFNSRDKAWRTEGQSVGKVVRDIVMDRGREGEHGGTHGNRALCCGIIRSCSHNGNRY